MLARAVLSIGLSLGCLAGCASEGQLWVDVYSDVVPGEEADTLSVTLDGAQTLFPIERGTRLLPVPARFGPFLGQAGETVSLRAALLRRGRTLLETSANVRVFRSVVVPVWLLRNCIRVACPGAGDPSLTECREGRCVPPACEGSECGPGCATSRDCGAPAVDCVAAECRADRCVWSEVPGACATTEYCDTVRGCVARSDADAGIGDAGPADAAPMDAGPPDTGPSTCVPDCPPDEVGAFSGCAFASDCAESAPDETRVVTRYACVAGSCTSSTTTEARSCARVTEGMSCGAESVGPFGECGGYSAASCPIAGTRSAPRTVSVCRASVCRAEAGPPVIEACASPPLLPMHRGWDETRYYHYFTTDMVEASCCGRSYNYLGFHTSAVYVPGYLEVTRCITPGGEQPVAIGVPCSSLVAGSTPVAALGWIAPGPDCGARPLYHMRESSREYAHFYTVSDTKYRDAMPMGWIALGVIGYAW